MDTFIGIPMLGFNRTNFNDRVNELIKLKNIKVLFYHNFKTDPSDEVIKDIIDAYSSLPHNFMSVVDTQRLNQGVLSVRIGIFEEFLTKFDYDSCDKFMTFDDDDKILLTQEVIDRNYAADVTRFNLLGYDLKSEFINNKDTKELFTRIKVPSYMYSTVFKRSYLEDKCRKLLLLRNYKLSMCEDMILSNYFTRSANTYEQVDQSLVEYVQNIGQTSTFVFNDYLPFDIFNKITKGVDLLRILMGDKLSDELYQYILFDNLSYNFWQIKDKIKTSLRNANV